MVTCCLVCEDQALIGMALEAYLEEQGIVVAGPFLSCAEALAWIEDDTPQVAILDYMLRDGPCTDLAQALIGRGVPVIIYSGFPVDAETPSVLRTVTWLEKPVDRECLMGAVAQLAPSLALRS
jgi:DNA-binding response OmpR family regulator